MKIVKLDIDANSVLAGIDAVALVEQPAIEEDFMFFSKHTEEEFAETYKDYPIGAVEAAKMGIKRNEALGNKCGTQVGKVRAQQLANREPVSLDTVRRMRAFLIRQKGNYDLAIERKDYNACGYISYLLWGGPEALSWSEKILRQIENPEEFDFSKEQVENVIVEELIKQEMSKFQNDEVSESFAAMDEKQIVVSPLMIPNKLIKRKDEEGEEYFVYFTKETIEKLAYKAMKDKVIHRVNIEHDGNLVDDIFMVETWTKESDNDKSKNYGYNLPDGTWFAKYKIDNKDIWNNYIKSGKVLGLSVEGMFEQLMLSKVK